MLRAELIAAVVLTTALGSPASAQVPPGLAYFSIGVYGGGSSITDLQRQDLLLTAPGGATRWSEQTVAAEPTAMVGAAATVWPSRYWGVRGHLGYGRTDITLQPGEEVAAGRDAGAEDLGVWLYDVAVVLRAPSIGSAGVTPYVLLGGGGVRYGLPSADEELRPTWLFDGAASRTRLAGVAGLGVDVPLQHHGLSLTFELVSHFSSTPVEVRSAELRAGADAGASSTGPATEPAPGATKEVDIVNQIRFSAGFTYSLRKSDEAERREYAQ